MTASVAGNYAKNRLKTALLSKEKAEAEREVYHREAGQRIAKTLGELKGAVMKVGQMASIAADVLPKEIADALGTLQKEAPPMAYEVIAEQIESEFGTAPETLFRRFDREPFAAASIGQVHRAQTDDGREVVVKVQYPGVDEAVDSDLSHLKVALRASGLIKVSKASLDASMAELRERLHEELDYTNEADNVRAFEFFHRDHPEIVVPEVIGERSSQRVLTLVYEEGDSISELDAKGYDQATRDKLGCALFDLMARQIFTLGAIHGDPNPGNLACRKDGRIVLYDYGCVKRLRPEILTAYRSTVLGGLAEEYDRVEEGLLALGVRNPEGPVPEFSYYKVWRDIFAEPFLRNPLFDFGGARLHEEVVKQIPGVLKHMRSFQAAPQMIFLDRMVAGHYGNLRNIKARVPVLEMLQPHLDRFDPDDLMWSEGVDTEALYARGQREGSSPVDATEG